MKLKQNIPLLIAVAIPIIMILVVAGSIYAPQMFGKKPQYNFLYIGNYTYNQSYYEVRDGKQFQHTYQIQNNHLTDTVRETTLRPDYYLPTDGVPPRLYVHDVATDTNREVTFDEAKQFFLDSSSTSPDGFELTSGTRDGGIFPFIFFAERDYSKMYLKSGNVSHPVTLSGEASTYYNRPNGLFGWIIK